MAKQDYMGIQIDLSRDVLFDVLGVNRLKESYMREDETSPQQRFAHVSKQFGSNPEHAQRLYEYSSKHWLSYSTPIVLLDLMSFMIEYELIFIDLAKKWNQETQRV